MPVYNSFWTKHTDKVLHFAAGFVVYLLAIGIAKQIFIAGIAVLVVAAAKEIWDTFKVGGKLDFFDILATLAGGVAGGVGFEILKMI